MPHRFQDEAIATGAECELCGNCRNLGFEHGLTSRVKIRGRDAFHVGLEGVRRDIHLRQVFLERLVA
jgi:hypothetical protein